MLILYSVSAAGCSACIWEDGQHYRQRLQRQPLQWAAAACMVGRGKRRQLKRIPHCKQHAVQQHVVARRLCGGGGGGVAAPLRCECVLFPGARQCDSRLCNVDGIEVDHDDGDATVWMLGGAVRVRPKQLGRCYTTITAAKRLFPVADCLFMAMSMDMYIVSIGASVVRHLKNGMPNQLAPQYCGKVVWSSPYWLGLIGSDDVIN